MTYTEEALANLDPLVRTLMEALDWDWAGGDGVPAADEVLEAVAFDLRSRYSLLPRVLTCGHDWVDGSCGARAPFGIYGWEMRAGRNGDTYWLCPEHAAQFPVSILREASEPERAHVTDGSEQCWCGVRIIHVPGRKTS